MNFQETPCMCGNKLSECIFWSGLVNSLVKSKGESFEIKYEKVIRQFDKIHGNEKILVDSSKYLHVLDNLAKLPYKLQVIYLIKDVRSYTLSQKRYFGRNTYKKKMLSRLLFSKNKYLFYQWFKENRKIKNYLVRNKIDFFQIGYEELCFKPIDSLKALCNYIGVDFEQDMLYPYKTNSHGTGNRMRRMPEKKKNIRYDYAWMSDKSLCFTSSISPRIMRFNKENV